MKLKDQLGEYKTLVILFLCILGALIIFTPIFWVIVKTGETGVASFFGKVYDQEIHSGFHLKNPLVAISPIMIQSNLYTSATTTAFTRDALPIIITATTLYHLNEEKASDIYRDVGKQYQKYSIEPALTDAILRVVSRYDAQTIISLSEKIIENITEILLATLAPQGIEIEYIFIQNITIPEETKTHVRMLLEENRQAELKRPLSRPSLAPKKP